MHANTCRSEKLKFSNDSQRSIGVFILPNWTILAKFEFYVYIRILEPMEICQLGDDHLTSESASIKWVWLQMFSEFHPEQTKRPPMT